MAEVDQRLQQLDGIIDEMFLALNNLANASSKDGYLHTRRVDNLSQQFRTAKEAYILELHGLTPDILNHYKIQLSERTSKFGELYTEFNRQKTKIPAEKVIQDVTAYDANFNISEEREQIVRAGNELQHKTQESLNRIMQQAQETENVGSQTVAMLSEQNKSLEKSTRGLHATQQNLGNAAKTLRDLIKAASSDWCLRILVVALILLIIALFLLLFL